MEEGGQGRREGETREERVRDGAGPGLRGQPIARLTSPSAFGSHCRKRADTAP